MDILIYTILFGLGCSYAVRVLLLQETTSHEGPFKIKTTFVLFPESKHIQQFALFDTIRLLFGVYKRCPDFSTTQRVYEVRDSWISEIWTCPYCLTFWVALPFTTIFFILFSPATLLLPVIHLAIAAWSLVIYRQTEI